MQDSRQRSSSSSPELFQLLRNRKVQALLVVLLALWAHKKWRYSRFNRGPFPDSWQRPADQHRSYIDGLLEFVDVYSQGSHEEAADGLEGELGVHTRCYTSQLALITYYCGRQQTAGQDYDIAQTRQLRSLLAAMRGPPGERALELRKTVVWQAAVAALGAQPAAAAEGGARQPAANGGKDDQAAAAEEDEDEAEAGQQGLSEGARQALRQAAQQLRYTSLGAWDGRQLPQLVFRIQIDGDDIAGHTFVIAMRPDLRFDVYQSFIGQYTLHQYLGWEPRALSFDEMMQFLSDMEKIERAAVWTKEVDRLYHRLFKVSLSRTCAYRGVTLGGGEAASGGSAAKAAREAGVVHWAMGEGKAVRLGWSLACTVPVNATSRAREPDGAPFDPFSV